MHARDAQPVFEAGHVAKQSGTRRNKTVVIAVVSIRFLKELHFSVKTEDGQIC